MLLILISCLLGTTLATRIEPMLCAAYEYGEFCFMNLNLEDQRGERQLASIVGHVNNSLSKLQGAHINCPGNGLTPDERGELLKAHNRLRSKIVKGAAPNSSGNLNAGQNMYALKYDCDLEKAAEDAMGGACRQATPNPNGHNVQAYTTPVMVAIAKNEQLQDAVQQWYQPVIQHGLKDPGNKFTDPRLQSFANLAHHKTTKVGCHYAKCSKPDRVVIGCMYNNPIQPNEVIYPKGTPCTKNDDCTVYNPSTCNTNTHLCRTNAKTPNNSTATTTSTVTTVTTTPTATTVTTTPTATTATTTPTATTETTNSIATTVTTSPTATTVTTTPTATTATTTPTATTETTDSTATTVTTTPTATTETTNSTATTVTTTPAATTATTTPTATTETTNSTTTTVTTTPTATTETTNSTATTVTMTPTATTATTTPTATTETTDSPATTVTTTPTATTATTTPTATTETTDSTATTVTTTPTATTATTSPTANTETTNSTATTVTTTPAATTATTTPTATTVTTTPIATTATTNSTANTATTNSTANTATTTPTVTTATTTPTATTVTTTPTATTETTNSTATSETTTPTATTTTTTPTVTTATTTPTATTVTTTPTATTETTNSTATSETTTPTATTTTTTTTATTAPTTSTATTATATATTSSPQGSGMCSNAEMTDEVRKKILDMHNWRRSQVALGRIRNGRNSYNCPTAANMYKMEYDCELEKSALDYAKQCSHMPSDPATRQGQGENVNSGRKKNDKMKEAKRAVQSWWNQIFQNGLNQKMKFIQNLRDKPNAPTAFTQMAWALSTKIGCAVVDCQGIPFTVCRYKKEGNVVPKQIYKIGPPCSACKTSCIGKGLCATP